MFYLVIILTLYHGGISITQPVPYQTLFACEQHRQGMTLAQSRKRAVKSAQGYCLRYGDEVGTPRINSRPLQRDDA